MDEFMAVPANRALVRTISLQATNILAPSETKLNKRFVEPLLDMVAQGETMTTETAELAMGLGGGELALMTIIPIVVQVLFQFLQKLGENNFEAVKSRLKREPPIAQIAGVVSLDERASEWIDRVKLRQVLDENFNTTELRDLCFDLNIDYENLAGENEANIAREIVSYAVRHGQICELFVMVKELRSHISWQGGVDSIGVAPIVFPGVPAEGVLVVYLPLQDAKRLASSTRFTRNQKAFQELVRTVNIALQEHSVSQYGK